jgi:tRNA A37 threonylcarbamoyladenosine dehydratase
MTIEYSADYLTRFQGLQRLYGTDISAILANLHICVVGLGGVGSWAVESLARSGIGKITIIDYDEVALSNTNRQSHTTTTNIARKKYQVMQERILDINPECTCMGIDDFVTTENLAIHMNPEHGYDYVIDAIDSIKFKAALIYYCKRNKIPIITTGGAGGCTDPLLISVKDLSRTYNDALAARVRSRLRNEFGFSKNTKRYFGVECVFSSQHKVYPKEDGSVGHEKPGIHGVHLDCRFGYGAASYVTACFGFIAVSRVINKIVARVRRTGESVGN